MNSQQLYLPAQDDRQNSGLYGVDDPRALSLSKWIVAGGGNIIDL